MKKICVIGLGLIGGSIALECKKNGYEVYGVDSSDRHQKEALNLKICDHIVSIGEGIEQSDIICIATPVHTIEKIGSVVLDQITADKVVFDVGSTKRDICQHLALHPMRNRFVASHPLAGTEFSGPRAAKLDLFRNKKNIICEEQLSDEKALEEVLTIFNIMGVQTLFMDPRAHDKHMAYVSHLSHVIAFTLSETVLDIEKDEKQIFNLASTGFESTVRLAKSSPDTWSAIFEKNSDHLVTALDQYIDHLTEFKDAIKDKNSYKLKEKMEHANEIKKVLKGMALNIVKLS